MRPKGSLKTSPLATSCINETFCNLFLLPLAEKARMRAVGKLNQHLNLPPPAKTKFQAAYRTQRQPENPTRKNTHAHPWN